MFHFIIIGGNRCRNFDSTFSLAIIAFGIISTITPLVDAFVVRRDFTELCGRNVTIVEPNESLRINFDVDLREEAEFLHHHHNCTAFVIWSGAAPFKLLPFTARSDHRSSSSSSSSAMVIGSDHKSDIVLSINDYLGQVIRLDMFGAKPFYLSITPMLKAQITGERNDSYECADHYRSCGHQVCIHHHFSCDGVVQCALDEVTDCFEMPTETFLLLTFLGFMFAFTLIAFLLASYIYYNFYRQTVFLLTADYKPPNYGAVNGRVDSFASTTTTTSSTVTSGHNSSNSLASSLLDSSARSQSFFHDNIQAQYGGTTANQLK